MQRILAAFFLGASTLVLAESAALFDGASMAGWQSTGDIEWSVVEGALQASGGGDGFLSTEHDYGDFQLRAEFWVDATTNSGIFIRCSDRSRIYPDTCYEMNIWDEHPKQQARTGAIVFRFMPPLVQVKTVGRWNSYEITAVGANIEVKVNGEVTAVLDDADPTAGFIALQHWEQGTVKFRNIQLEVR